MASLDLLVKAWDTGHWELGEGFKGLPDEDVWRRPDPKLLSVGEIAAHIAYWESQNTTGGAVTGPLVDAAARYYTTSIDTPMSLAMGAQAVYEEVERVHQEARKAFLEQAGDSDAKVPFRPEWTWGGMLEYMAFHVAYHTGQVYSVRHLFGHPTTDN